MKKVDVIVVGQGIAGTMIGLHLEKSGITFHFFDDHHDKSSSMVAAGIINPVTGRNYVKSWRIDELLPYAIKMYQDLEFRFGISFFHHLPIIRTINSVQEENQWYSRASDPAYEPYVSVFNDHSSISGIVRSAFSYGSIHEAFQVNLPLLLTTMRSYWEIGGILSNSKFHHDRLKVDKEGVSYDNIHAKAVIFAEGWQSGINPFFPSIPSTPVKGEVLIIKFEPTLSYNVRDDIFITPLGDGTYWCGSNYQKVFEDEKPTEDGYSMLMESLNQILLVPFSVEAHMAGVRPASRHRKPIVECHPEYKHVIVFNGLGAKGSSLAPLIASECVENQLLPIL